MLKYGKVTDVIYKRAVEKILGDVHREDCRMESDTAKIVMAAGFASGVEKHIGACAVHQAVNRLAAAGAKPAGVGLQVHMPDGAREDLLEKMIGSASRAAKALNITIGQCDVNVIQGIEGTIITATAIGEADTLFIPEATKADQDIIMAGFAGYRGSALMTFLEREILEQHFNQVFLENLLDSSREAIEFSALSAVETAAKAGVRSMYAIEDGGVFAALWAMSERDELGVNVNLKQIPIRQDTVEVCDYYRINPYQMLSTGAVLLAADHGQKVLSELAAAGIPAVIIGHFTDNNDRVVISDDETRYLEPFRKKGFI